MDSYKVVDNGLKETPKDSMIVVVLPPMKRSQVQEFVKRLQLYKG